MNPDKLFDYLDDRLSGVQRAELEKQLIADPQLQRELAVAREIHTRMRSDSREVFVPGELDASDRSRKIALRVGAMFLALMAVNVGVGLWLIARHATTSSRRALLETQLRQQITKALEHAATTLTPAPLGVSEVTVAVPSGKLEEVAEQVVTIASQLGGSAIKGLPDRQQLTVLVNVPTTREAEFRGNIAAITGGKLQPSTSPAGTAPTAVITRESPSPGATDKRSYVVQLVETASKQN